MNLRGKESINDAQRLQTDSSRICQRILIYKLAARRVTRRSFEDDRIPSELELLAVGLRVHNDSDYCTDTALVWN
jgi:hypothetical protein